MICFALKGPFGIAVAVAVSCLTSSALSEGTEDGDPSEVRAELTRHIGHADPRMLGGQHKSISFCYMGNGRVLKMQFSQPGYILENSSTWQLDEDKQKTIDQLLENIEHWRTKVPDLTDQLANEKGSYSYVLLRGIGGDIAVLDERMAMHPEFDTITKILEAEQQVAK